MNRITNHVFPLSKHREGWRPQGDGVSKLKYLMWKTKQIELLLTPGPSLSIERGAPAGKIG